MKRILIAGITGQDGSLLKEFLQKKKFKILGLSTKINKNKSIIKTDYSYKSLKKIILSCIEKDYKEILLITGKGIHSNTEQDVYASKDLSKLRYSVPEYINSNLNLSKHIVSISDADKKNGGDGAIIIKLKKL